VRLFEKRRDQPNKGKLVTAEKRKNKKDIKLRDHDLKPPKNAKGGVGLAAKLANPLRSQADLIGFLKNMQREQKLSVPAPGQEFLTASCRVICSPLSAPLKPVSESADRSGADRTWDRAGVAQE